MATVAKRVCRQGKLESFHYDCSKDKLKSTETQRKNQMKKTKKNNKKKKQKEKEEEDRYYCIFFWNIKTI